MKDFRSAGYFLDLVFAKVSEIVKILKGDWIDLFEPVLTQLMKATDKEQVVIIANEIYELGMKTKAKKIFEEIHTSALSQSDSYEPSKSEWYLKPGMARENSIMGLGKPFILYAEGRQALHEIKKLQREKLKKEASKPNKGKGQGQEESQRFANVGLFNLPSHTRKVSPKNALRKNTEYFIRINIGSKKKWDSEKGPAVGFPDEHLPKRKQGHLLDVIVTSNDFTVANKHYKLFLPRRGDSDQIHVSIITPDRDGEATLRIGFYYKNNLLQCKLFTAQVGKEIPEDTIGYTSVTDYTLTRTLKDVSDFSPRTANIFTNDNPDGSKRVILVGIGKNSQQNIVYHNILSENQVKDLLKRAREALHDTHRKLIHEAKLDGNGKVVIDAQYDPLDKMINGINHAKNRSNLIADLKELARLGRVNWTQLFNLPDDLLEIYTQKMGEGQVTIQTGSAQGISQPIFYPWSIIYDIELDLLDSDKWTPCHILDNWEPGTSLGTVDTKDCPHRNTHSRNTICPFGFWGYRHFIEQPLSIPANGSFRKEIIVSSDNKIEMVIGYHNKLAAWNAHLRNLQKYKMTVFDISAKQDLFNVLGQPGRELIYFFCHGRRDRVPGTDLWMPYLEIGNGEKITTEELLSWRMNSLKDTWASTCPLVFINGCHTAELTPDALADFVTAFINANASGVVGTEVTVADTLASEVAELFFSRFLEKDGSVGKAIRSMRFDLLSRGSIMGLAYTPYCSSDLHIA